MQTKHTKEELGALTNIAVSAYPLLTEGESITFAFPLSKIISPNGERPLGFITITKPLNVMMLQAGIAPKQSSEGAPNAS